MLRRLLPEKAGAQSAQISEEWNRQWAAQKVATEKVQRELLSKTLSGKVKKS